MKNYLNINIVYLGVPIIVVSILTQYYLINTIVNLNVLIMPLIFLIITFIGILFLSLFLKLNRFYLVSIFGYIYCTYTIIVFFVLIINKHSLSHNHYSKCYDLLEIREISNQKSKIILKYEEEIYSLRMNNKDIPSLNPPDEICLFYSKGFFNIKVVNVPE